MIFFDEQNPNKYSKLKKLLVPHDIDGLTRTRFGEADGSYILAKELMGKPRILSYGINSDVEGVSFEENVFDLCDQIHMYDGSVDKYPAREVLPRHAKFFKEFVDGENFPNHFDRIFDKNNDNYIIKMDIEGWEYDVFSEKNMPILKDNVSQIAFECHGLIEEHPQGWDMDEKTKEAKENFTGKLDFFKRLNENFVLFHMHGNNHGPRYVDFPDVVELLYVNKKLVKRAVPCNYRMPIEGLDSPCYHGRPDYILDWYL